MSLSACAVHIHDDFLSGGVVGDEADGLLLVRHRLGGVHDVLEHGSLSVVGRRRKQSDGRKTHWQVAAYLSPSVHLLEVKRQVSGNDANIEQMLHVLELSLLEVAEDVEFL